MKILTLHANSIKVTPKKKAIKTAEDVKKDEIISMAEGLVVFCATEKKDEKNPEKIIENLVSGIEKHAEQVNVKTVMLYPYVHLTNEPSNPDFAFDTLKKTDNSLVKKGFKVLRAPFGWYKAFNIDVKGHPLAELSKVITSDEPKLEEKRHKLKKDFYIMDVSGKLYKINEYKYKKGEENFKILVDKEALGKGLPQKGEPEYIKAMKKFGFDYESASDAGHMRYGPDAALIFDLVTEYSRDVVKTFDFPVYEIKGTQFFNLKDPAVAEHAKLFGDRLYTVKVDNKEFIMRYAACHQQFKMLKDWTISYKNLPFGAFEVADSYRLEQSGEIVFGFRMRRFIMPDMHVFCKDTDQAKKEFLKVHKKIYDEASKMNRDYWDLYNITDEFLKEHKDWIQELVKYKGRPILISTVPQGEFYWTINIEYHIIDKTKVPREIATVQMDVGNAERFGITYATDNDKQKNPIILHTAVIGGIERYIYGLFDTALSQKNPALPLWVTPTQIRLCSVNDSSLNSLEKIANNLESENIRVDIDDRNESISKKIRDAELQWVPFSVVVGEKEIEKGILTVRFRETGKIKEMKINELVSLIKKETKEYPFRKLNNARFLSKRPKF